jgi:regulatory protein
MSTMTFIPKEGNQERWEILKDGEKWREVHRTIFGKNPVFPPLNSGNDCQFIFDDYEYRRVKGYVIWRLSTQSYHSEQLAKLLSERLIQKKTIERVIQEYIKMGVLDDESWVQNFMSSHQKRYSLRLLLTKLKDKGLSSDSLKRIEMKWKNPEEEIQTIQHLLRTRYRSKDLSHYQTKQKVTASLVRRGYGYDQVQAALQLIN